MASLRVISYNFSTYGQDKGTISKIEIIDLPDYYLINDRTKVTGTHPFYIEISEGIKLSGCTIVSRCVLGRIRPALPQQINLFNPN